MVTSLSDIDKYDHLQNYCTLRYRNKPILDIHLCPHNFDFLPHIPLGIHIYSHRVSLYRRLSRHWLNTYPFPSNTRRHPSNCLLFIKCISRAQKSQTLPTWSLSTFFKRITPVTHTRKWPVRILTCWVSCAVMSRNFTFVDVYATFVIFFEWGWNCFSTLR